MLVTTLSKLLWGVGDRLNILTKTTDILIFSPTFLICRLHKAFHNTFSPTSLYPRGTRWLYYDWISTLNQVSFGLQKTGTWKGSNDPRSPFAHRLNPYMAHGQSFQRLDINWSLLRRWFFLDFDITGECKNSNAVWTAISNTLELLTT